MKALANPVLLSFTLCYFSFWGSAALSVGCVPILLYMLQSLPWLWMRGGRREGCWYVEFMVWTRVGVVLNKTDEARIYCQTECHFSPLIFHDGSKVLAAVSAKFTFLWYAESCTLVVGYQYFGSTCCFQLQGGTVEMEIACSSKSFVPLYQATLCLIWDHSHGRFKWGDDRCLKSLNYY
jgi:hypothetical protein